MLLSLIVAFGIWIWVAIEKSPVVEVTISPVPVQIDMENSVPAQLNLQMFGQTEYYVDVTVSAKRFVASTLTASDISVTAQTNYVDSAGTKSLQLRATAANSRILRSRGFRKIISMCILTPTRKPNLLSNRGSLRPMKAL